MSLNTNSLLFETGNSEYGTIASSLVNPVSGYSIEMWVKLNSEISSGIYEFFHLENNTSKHTVYCQYEYNAGTRRLTFQEARWVVIGYTARYTVTLGTSNWTHLAFTRTAAGVMQIYVNGVAVGTTDTADNTTGNTTTNDRCEIGSGATEGTTTRVNYSNARIDELRVWSTVRTAGEILANKSVELTGSETGLVEYIKFNDGSGTTATATTGTNATLVNTPTWSTDVPFPGSVDSSFFIMF